MLNEMMNGFNSTYRVRQTAIDCRALARAHRLAADEMKELADEFVMIEDDELNKVNAVKEMADVIYIMGQQMAQMGIDIEAVLNEVHRSNMSKVVQHHNVQEELAEARKRYPDAYVDEAQRYCVLRCSVTKKVIKPMRYSPAVITKEMLGA